MKHHARAQSPLTDASFPLVVNPARGVTSPVAGALGLTCTSVDDAYEAARTIIQSN